MATIKDIAKMTGYSLMTVSRALNEPQKVKDETRLKIMEAVQKCGYVQSVVARSLAKGMTSTICLYMPSTLNTTSRFVAQTISSVAERLGERGFSISFRRQLSADFPCDGIIAAGLNIDEEDEFMRISQTKPAVLYGNSERFVNWVDVDNYQGIYDMTKLVIEKGHRKIAYIGMHYPAHYVEQRKLGFTDAMKSCGIELKNEYIYSCENTEDGGFKACEILLSKVRPTAIVCATDLIAIGCMHSLHRHDIRIPSQVAVSGFDGFGMEHTVFPTLTTVKQPLYDMGIKLADAVLAMINGNKQEKGIFVKPTIEIGGSV
ncbi:MAG: LacI family transcriptional regulator [Corallococcus sp.]|nr:LacI family transcriptional regulator [Corallococcus sp.]MCM1359492.1 LacI family transcriptional regulator [Corallococcus sp.]MCM1394696.1 LacI family transcriptional regulator [Corallococcus sp.]